MISNMALLVLLDAFVRDIIIFWAQFLALSIVLLHGVFVEVFHDGLKVEKGLVVTSNIFEWVSITEMDNIDFMMFIVLHRLLLGSRLTEMSRSAAIC